MKSKIDTKASGIACYELARKDIDTGFLTARHDVFDSGLARQVGMNSLGVWMAIKRHADYNTGECWPGIRRLIDLTGLASATVQKSIKTLIDAKMLRVSRAGGGTRSTCYIARERLDIYLLEKTLCSIVVDYIPANMGERIQEIKNGLMGAPVSTNLYTECEIIPGDGFVWDDDTKVLRSTFETQRLFTNLLKDCG